MRKLIPITIIIIGALFGAYLSVVVAGEWADEQKYVYTSQIDYALDYLSDDPYKNLVIEVDWIIGCEPDWSAMSFLVNRIKEYCDKESVYIDRNYSDEILPYRSSYGMEDILKLEEDYRSLYKNGDTAVIYILYLNGKFIDSSPAPTDVYTEVVGMAYTHSSVAIFKDEIRSVADVGLSVEYTERSILLHEFGHLICLVGIGYTATHEDPEHPHHTIHEDGVMYYAINATEGAAIPPQDFCEDSKLDIDYLKGQPRDISNVVYIPWLLLLADITGAIGLIIAVIAKKERAEYPTSVHPSPEYGEYYYPEYGVYYQEEYVEAERDNHEEQYF